MLEEKAEVPVVVVVPYMSVTLDDEDSLAESLLPKDMDLINIGVVRLPRLSNFTDFSALDQIAGVSVHYVRDPYEIEKMDMVILPGTKNTMGDLAWMRLAWKVRSRNLPSTTGLWHLRRLSDAGTKDR